MVLAWRNAPEVAAHMYTDHTVTEAEHARWIHAVLAADDRRYWIVLMDEAPVGLANVVGIDRANRRCDWAYYLADPATRGKGVGAAVEYRVLREVFGPIGLNKLCCEVFLENEAVWRMHESFGFTREALYRDHVWKGGRFHDVLGLAMLAADWERVRPEIEARLTGRGIDPEQIAIRGE
jgi:UDP-4-amino-4,6-dideoxy-N-acetyl-beta-L-altrosamine N-acetyltransferase